jgi:poly(3-hydroxybutyrate) depolymerase
MIRVLLVLLVSLALASCGKEVEIPNPEMQRYTLRHDGLLREYFVFLPSTYEAQQEHPVAIFMHGYGGTATGTEAEVAQGLNQYAEEYGYVMVYPQGTWFMSSADGGEPWEVTSWNHVSDGFDTGPDGPICTSDAPRWPCPPECGKCGQCGWSSCNDDIGFLRALVAEVTGQWKVDAGRVHVTGFSNGAMMAHRIACEASELFASVALVGGRLERGFECTPAKRLPLLQINGGADETVPSNGRVSSYSQYFASTTSVTRHWNDGLSCGVELEDWSTSHVEGENVQCTIACAYRCTIHRLPVAGWQSSLAGYSRLSRQQRLLCDGIAGREYAGPDDLHCTRRKDRVLGISTVVRVLQRAPGRGVLRYAW